MYMVGFYSHEAVKCCYITADGILCIQLVIGFIACRMLSHFMYFVRNDEIKMFNQSLISLHCRFVTQIWVSLPSSSSLLFIIVVIWYHYHYFQVSVYIPESEVQWIRSVCFSMCLFFLQSTHHSHHILKLWDTGSLLWAKSLTYISTFATGLLYNASSLKAVL